MPAEKSIHITLKFNVDSEVCEAACRAGEWNRAAYAQEKIREAAVDTLRTLMTTWVRDGSPYGPPDIPKSPDVPMPAPVHTKTVPAISATNYEECLSCQ